MLRVLKCLLALPVVIVLGLCLLVALAVVYWRDPDLMELDS